jgi:uncharacterized RDD family membrane protein YckC
MTQDQTNPTVGLRLAAMLVDHFAMTFLSAIGAMLIIAPFALVLHLMKDIEINVLGSVGSSVIMGLLFSVYYNKDIVKGRSVAKRMLRLQLVDINSNHAATPVQCVLRNLTLPLWPFEVLVTLISPTRRIGDRIAGTRVVAFDPDRIDPPVRRSQYAIAILIGLAIVTLTIGLVLVMMSKLFPQ